MVRYFGRTIIRPEELRDFALWRSNLPGPLTWFLPYG